jgi:hypothetical protein
MPQQTQSPLGAWSKAADASSEMPTDASLYRGMVSPFSVNGVNKAELARISHKVYKKASRFVIILSLQNN